jgi:chaperonin cofactor prefoldin
MTDELRKKVKSLQQTVRRLKDQNVELEAEISLCQMMIHDFAAPDVIGVIEKRFPALAKKWAES